MNREAEEALTAILRVANPWLVGHNYGRIVPLYVLHNLVRDARPPAQSRGMIDSVKALVFGNPAEPNQDIGDPYALGAAIRGALAADRRVFRNRRTGGVYSNQGALLPVVGNLIEPSPSDDGLGSELLSLIHHVGLAETFEERLHALYTLPPADCLDPVTRLARLLGGTSSDTAERENTDVLEGIEQPTSFDSSLADFVMDSLVPSPDPTRLQTLRDLAVTAYFVAILRMLQGPIVAQKGQPLPVIVYGGLPPGHAGDSAVAAATLSLRALIRTSLAHTIEATQDKMRNLPALPESDELDAFRQRVRALVGRVRPPVESLLRRTMSEWFHSISSSSVATDNSPSPTLDEFLRSALGFSEDVIARRVRGMGTTIGFAAPDRGASPMRLVLETPVLGMLVGGLVPTRPLPFNEFIDAAYSRLGLVLGIGTRDDIVDKVTPTGYSGPPLYDVLLANEDALRRRLLRAGLARTFSDSHTEVLSSAAVLAD